MYASYPQSLLTLTRVSERPGVCLCRGRRHPFYYSQLPTSNSLAFMFRCLVISMFAAFCAVPAAAQINTLQADNPRENARLNVGPLYVTPAIQLTELGLDTNVFNTPIVQLKDFTFTVRPSAQVWMPIARRALVKANAGADLVWYQKYGSERSIDPMLTVRGEAYLRRFTLFADNTFSHTRQRPGDNLEIDARSRVLSNVLRAGVDLRLTPKASLELHGRWSAVDWDADDSLLGGSLEETLNRNTAGFGAVVRYRLSVLTTLELFGERFEERFPLSPERDGDNVRIMLGIRFEPRALISGYARVGVRHLNPIDETVLPEFKGLASDIGLSYTVLGSTTIGVTQTRDILYSFELTQPYYVDTGLGLRIRRALGRAFDVEGTLSRHALAYKDLVGEPRPVSPGRVDIIWNYGGSLGYRLGRSGRIGFGATYWKRRSAARASREYDGLRVGTTASYGF